MKRAAELIFIVPEEREAYLKKYTEPSEQTAKLLWKCGIRRQFYYAIDNLLLRTYEYTGKHFLEDMEKISSAPETSDFFLKKRRRDVAEAEREHTNWWAPLKWYGSSLTSDPCDEDEDGEEENMTCEERYHCMTSGDMGKNECKDFCYDDDDWSESIHM